MRYWDEEAKQLVSDIRSAQRTDGLVVAEYEEKLLQYAKDIRQSQTDHLFSVIRSLGYKIDQRAVVKKSREWEASAARETERRNAIQQQKT